MQNQLTQTHIYSITLINNINSRKSLQIKNIITLTYDTIRSLRCNIIIKRAKTTLSPARDTHKKDKTKHDNTVQEVLYTS